MGRILPFAGASGEKTGKPFDGTRHLIFFLVRLSGSISGSDTCCLSAVEEALPGRKVIPLILPEFPHTIMTSSTLSTLLQSVPDGQSARLSLSTTTGKILHLDCTYKEGSSPRFFLLLPPGTFPEDADMAQRCTVSISNADESAAPLSVTATIDDVVAGSTVELTARGTLDPTKLRQYFRVTVCAPVTITFPKKSDKGPSQGSLTGETLDLSGSGLLALFNEECENRQNIAITLELSSPKASVSCIGHIVFARRVRRGRWQIALHFDDITNKQRDMIISNCLFEQRNQLKKGLQPIA